MALNFNGTDVGTLKMGTTDIANLKMGSTDVYNSRIVIPQLSGLNAICADSSGNSLYAMLGKELQETVSDTTRYYADIMIYKLNNTTKRWETYTRLAGYENGSPSYENILVNNSISRSISIQNYGKVKSVDGHNITFYTSNYIFSRNSAYVYYFECGTYTLGESTPRVRYTHYINIIRYDISTKTETTIASTQRSGERNINIQTGSISFNGTVYVSPRYIYFINDSVIAATFVASNGNGGSSATPSYETIALQGTSSIVKSTSFIIDIYDTSGNLKKYAVPASTIYDETSTSNYGGFAYYNYSGNVSGKIRYFLHYVSKRSDLSYIYPEKLNDGTTTNKTIWEAKSSFKYKYKGNYIEYPGVSPCIFKGELVCLNPSGKICQYNGNTWIVNGVEQDHF